MSGESAFLFCDDVGTTMPGPAQVATVPTGIQDPDVLLNELARILCFPEYFGHNWNALWDCLNDFSWFHQHRITIVHSDFPCAHDAESLRTYLSILSDAVVEWKGSGVHDLTVIFPTSSKDTVAKLLAPRKRSLLRRLFGTDR